MGLMNQVVLATKENGESHWDHSWLIHDHGIVEDFLMN